MQLAIYQPHIGSTSESDRLPFLGELTTQYIFYHLQDTYI
jgi:hypothetical protein